MSDIDPAKLRAAQAAAALVTDGMVVGLGSGSTASLVIVELGKRAQSEGLRLVGVPTSEASASLAREWNLPLTDLDTVDTPDVDIDGADEVDPQFRMIKGRGGALLREKIVAAASKRRIIVVSPGKQVERLGIKYPIPVEVSPFGSKQTERYLAALGAITTVRRREDGSPVATDGKHKIIDCRFPRIDDPDELDRRLHQVVGVFETGLFLGLCDLLVVGHEDHAEILENPAG